MNFRPQRLLAHTMLALLALQLPHAASALELKNAVELTMKNNAEIRAKWHVFRSSLDETDVVRAGYRPTVDLNYSAARESRKSAQGSSSNFTRHGYNLNLAQNLFQGFITRSQVRQFDFASRARYYEYLATAEGQSQEAVRAFIDVVRYGKLVEIAEENYAVHKGIYEQILQRVTQGVGRRVDLEQIAGRLALAEANLVNETSNLHDVSARYTRITGEIPPAEMTLPPLEQALIPPPAQLMPLADANNPTLLAARAFYRAAEADIDIRRGAFLPTLDLQANKRVTNNLDGVKGKDDRQALELVLGINLYRGGADRARLAGSLERKDESEALGVKACRDMRQQVSIAYSDIQRISGQLEALRQHQLSTEKARDAYRKQFDIGQRTLLDMLDSENELFESRRELLNAELNQRLAVYRVLGESGRLLEALQLKPKDEIQNGENDLNVLACPTQYTPPPAFDRERIAARNLGNDTPIVANTQPAPLERDLTINLQVQFDLNTAAIRAESKPMLDQLAGTLTMPQMAGKRFLVEGHTDSSGNAAANLSLSQRRADAVRDYLASHGVAADRMDSVGRGSSQPLAGKASNDPLNRRVAVVLQEANKPAPATAVAPAAAKPAAPKPAAAKKAAPQTTDGIQRSQIATQPK